jgi:hypothetical protein
MLQGVLALADGHLQEDFFSVCSLYVYLVEEYDTLSVTAL